MNALLMEMLDRLRSERAENSGGEIVHVGGITGITPTGKESGDSGSLQSMLEGLVTWASGGGGGLSGAVILAPDSATRNTVVPTAITYPNLTLKSIASQTARHIRGLDSSDVEQWYITPSGGAAFASLNLSGLTASQALLTDGSKNLVSVATTGSGSVVRATSPTIAGPTFTGTIATALTASRTVVTNGSGQLSVNTETGTGNHVKSASPTLTGTVSGASSSWSGTLTTGSTISSGVGTGTATLLVNGAAANNRTLSFQTAGATRWAWITDATAESGSNTGSKIFLRAFTDAGVTIDSPIDIVRASGGAMTLSRPITASSTLGVTGLSTLGDHVALSRSAGTSIYHTLSNQSVFMWGGNVGQGSNLLLYGPSHATLANDFALRQTSTNVIYYDHSATSLTLSPAVTHSSTLLQTGVATFTAAPVFNSVTASQFLLVDGSKALTSVGGTGSGSVVRATSPTIVSPTINTELTLDYTFGGANARLWSVTPLTNELLFHTKTDAGAFGSSWLSVIRSGTSVSSVSVYPNTTVVGMFTAGASSKHQTRFQLTGELRKTDSGWSTSSGSPTDVDVSEISHLYLSYDPGVGNATYINLTNPADGQYLCVHNQSARNLYITEASGGGGTAPTTSYQAVLLRYDSTLSEWVQLG